MMTDKTFTLASSFRHIILNIMKPVKIRRNFILLKGSHLILTEFLSTVLHRISKRLNGAGTGPVPK
jgi:hypothetical protein